VNSVESKKTAASNIPNSMYSNFEQTSAILNYSLNIWQITNNQLTRIISYQSFVWL